MSPSKQRIFEEAARLFQEKGYHASSMRELASRLGLTVSSIYSHIGGKEEILQKICMEHAYRFMRLMEETEQMDASPEEKVLHLIRQHIHIATDDVTSVTVFNDEWRHLSQPWLDEFIKMRKDYERRFSKLIQQGQEAGAFAQVDPVIALFTILTSLRWLHHWYPARKGISLQSLEENILSVLMKGLLKR